MNNEETEDYIKILIKFLDKNINRRMYGYDREKFKNKFLNIFCGTKGESFPRENLFIFKWNFI